MVANYSNIWEAILGTGGKRWETFNLENPEFENILRDNYMSNLTWSAKKNHG